MLNLLVLLSIQAEAIQNFTKNITNILDELAQDNGIPVDKLAQSYHIPIYILSVIAFGLLLFGAGKKIEDNLKGWDDLKRRLCRLFGRKHSDPPLEDRPDQGSVPLVSDEQPPPTRPCC